MLEKKFHHIPPQANIPTEVIIHYIVKDYRRMYQQFDDFERRANDAESQFDYLTKRAENAEAKVEQLTLRAEKAEAMYEELSNQKNEKSIKKEKVEKLQNQVQEQQDEIKLLKDKLEKIKKQNMFLAQAIVSQLNDEDQKPQLIQGLTLSVDPKELEKKIGTQLGDAYMKLTSIEQKLNISQEAIETFSYLYGNSSEMKMLKGNIVASIGKIESAVKHIDNFYKLVNGIPLI